MASWISSYLSATPAPNGVNTTNGVNASNGTHLVPNYTILEQPIGTRRPIRVVCLGAGYSGLMMGILFSERMKDVNAEFVIYERNDDLGGTWLENRCVATRISL